MNLNNQSKTKKPFGLTLACKIAADAIKQSVAPSSIVLANLLFLQKESHFPKELNTHYFSFQKKNPTEIEKKTIGFLLDALKKPQDNVATMLESHIAKDWVVKKIMPVLENKKIIGIKPKQQSKQPKKTSNHSKEISVPVVVVKKSKLSI